MAPPRLPEAERLRRLAAVEKHRPTGHMWMLRVDNGGTLEQLHEELDAVMMSLSWVRP